MQSILHHIPTHLITLVQTLRALLLDPRFLDRHRLRAQDFTRQCQLTFPVLMIFLLQKTVRSLQRHLHEFLDELAQGELFEPLTSGAVTHARAKLKHTAFIELNQAGLLPVIYAKENSPRLWRACFGSTALAPAEWSGCSRGPIRKPSAAGWACPCRSKYAL
jgi:hypothetical protein